MEMATDLSSTFNENSCIKMVRYTSAFSGQNANKRSKDTSGFERENFASPCSDKRSRADHSYFVLDTKCQRQCIHIVMQAIWDCL